jgi:hypothetical protein
VLAPNYRQPSIAFITDGPTVRDILVHLGEPTAPPRIAPARGPPPWDLPDAGPGTFVGPNSFASACNVWSRKTITPRAIAKVL